MIALIGSEGSMGKRYQAILRHLGQDFRRFDRDDAFSDIVEFAKSANGVIVATPTDTHAHFLRALIPVNKRILCEKPIDKSPEVVKELFSLAEKHQCKLSMMLQYSSITNSVNENEVSYYDYFRTGPDGLPWDAFQTIALAKGSVFFGNTSPVWRCMINGETLNLSDMDYAYLSFTRSWLKYSVGQTPAELIRMHEKVSSYVNKSY